MSRRRYLLQVRPASAPRRLARRQQGRAILRAADALPPSGGVLKFVECDARRERARTHARGHLSQAQKHEQEYYQRNQHGPAPRPSGKTFSKSGARGQR